MTDDRLERALSEAIADLAGTGSPDYLDDILERTSRTRQRPWWTFPGRYTTMTPTLKFAVAATLSFVLGVAVSPHILPSDESTISAPAGAVAPVLTEEPSSSMATTPASSGAAVEFESRWVPGGTAERGAVESHDSGLVTFRDTRWELWVDETTDPRLDGKVNLVYNSDGYPGAALTTRYFRIENEDGAWQERPTTVIQFMGESDPQTTTSIFDGEGAYEGLIAVAAIAFGDQHYGVRGAIFESPAPTAPELRDFYD